ncbi:MAG: hypothetical protein R2778_18465 [Saprospiraceae bacterium]
MKSHWAVGARVSHWQSTEKDNGVYNTIAKSITSGLLYEIDLGP